MPDAPIRPQAWADGWIPGADDDEAFTIALEHMRWCRQQRIPPMEVLVALQIKTRRVIPYDSSWDDLVWALALAYQELPPAMAIEAKEEQFVLPLQRVA